MRHRSRRLHDQGRNRREDIDHRDGRASGGILGVCANDKIAGRFEQRSGSADAEHDEAFDGARRFRIRARSPDQYHRQTGSLGKRARTEDAEHHGLEHQQEAMMLGQHHSTLATAPDQHGRRRRLEGSYRTRAAIVRSSRACDHRTLGPQRLFRARLALIPDVPDARQRRPSSELTSLDERTG